ncbi:MAG TPA: hypothetical protein VJN43_15050 [Bryobacteraceae bacterium]|nr:hypothetical protein [Bryobacteraceae bacterium]
MASLLADKDVTAVSAAVEVGILRGRQLLNWWTASRPALVQFNAGLIHDGTSHCFFTNMELEGKPSSVMGCLQTAAYHRSDKTNAAAAGAALREWLGTRFLRETNWTGADGLPGGFLYRPALVRDLGAPAARAVEPDTLIGISEIGTRYEWAALRLDVLDYMKAFPPRIGRYDRWLRRFNNEAGYMIFHPAYFVSPTSPPAGVQELFCFGYAVAPWIITPTFVAFGAGRFYSAMKQYRFYMNEDGALKIEIAFIVAPRTQKIMNFGGWDPVYGTVGFIDLLTLRLTKIVLRAHDAIDHYAMGHHVRVHQNMLDGLLGVLQGMGWEPGATSPESVPASAGAV